MATYTQADKDRNTTAIWQIIMELEAEYEATRNKLIASGSFHYSHPALRSLIARIDRMRAEAAKR